MKNSAKGENQSGNAEQLTLVGYCGLRGGVPDPGNMLIVDDPEVVSSFFTRQNMDLWYPDGHGKVRARLNEAGLPVEIRITLA